MALSVNSVDKALERASALECQSYVGKIGPGEATVPAVAGVEGSLIYFIGAGDLAWRDDFAPAEPLAHEGRLRKVDHLSNVVRRGEFLSWSLFYGAVLGLKPQPQVEIADPHGAFFSRLLAQPERRIAHRAQRRRGRRDGRLALSRRFRRRRLPADRALERRHLRRRRSGEGERRRLPAHSRQLLRRSRDPLRHRPRSARPHARARHAVRPGEGRRVFPHLYAQPSRTAFSSRSSSGAITTCSAPPIRLSGSPPRRA